MGRQVIKQPDGLFAIFSTGADTLIMWDATRGDVMAYFEKRAIEDNRREVTRLLDSVEADDPEAAYYQFTMTWDEAIRKDREHGGSWPHGDKPEPDPQQ